MSADIYLRCFDHGEPKTFLRGVFEEIVARNSVASQFPFTRVCFPDGIDIYSGDSDALDGLTSSLYGGEFFFQSLYELADRTRLIWPDILPALAAANPTVVGHVPADMLDGIGPAEVSPTRGR
jgi:hypothetical protein